jgi:hypothetical protein
VPDIGLSEEQIAATKQRSGPATAPRDSQWRRQLEIDRIETEARRFDLDHLNDPFWVAGTMLYWGEGSKTHRAHSLANADPAAMRLFVAWTGHTSTPPPPPSGTQSAPR